MVNFYILGIININDFKSKKYICHRNYEILKFFESIRTIIPKLYFS